MIVPTTAIPALPTAEVDADIETYSERNLSYDMKTMDEVEAVVENAIDTAVEEPKTRTEEIKATGESVVGKVKELVHQGNIRRVTIRDSKDRNLIDIPLTVGVVGAIVAPQLAAIGAIAALLTDCSLVVEKLDEG